MKVFLKDIAILLPVYLIISGAVIAGTAVIADIYYGCPFPVGLFIGSAGIACVMMMNLLYLAARSFFNKFLK